MRSITSFNWSAVIIIFNFLPFHRRHPPSLMSNQTVRRCLLIHLVDDVLIILIDDRAAYLQRIGQLSIINREMMGTEREALDLLVGRQSLLQRLDALHHHVVNLLIGAKLLPAFKLDAVSSGPCLDLIECRNDEC